MKTTPQYVGEPPKWYLLRMSTWWWLGSWKFLKFILRELSSVFVAYSAAILLLLARAVGRGPDAYVEFQQDLKHPLVILLNLISLFFVLFHAMSWFNLAPKAMPVRVQGKRVPDALVAASNYALWLVVSVIVAWLLLRG